MYTKEYSTLLKMDKLKLKTKTQRNLKHASQGPETERESFLLIKLFQLPLGSQMQPLK